MSVAQHCLRGLIASLAIPAAARMQAAEWSVGNLRVEHMTAPLGIDTPEPRFSWVCTSKRRGERQSACRISVATTSDLLEAGQPDMWDSGRVVSDRTLNLAYRGRKLEGGRSYYWRVESWNRDGKQVAARTAEFGTGLYDDLTWQAAWIGRPSQQPDFRARLHDARWIWSPEGEPRHKAMVGERYFRFGFDVKEQISEASLLITVDDSFDAWLNGKALGIPKPRDRRFEHVSRIDITNLVRAGKNVLAVAGRCTRLGAGVLASIEIRPKAGVARNLVSNKTWIVSPTKVESWNQLECATEGFKPARELARYGAAPWGQLTMPVLPEPPSYLRRSFAVSGKTIRRARLYATALGVYDVAINGKRVGRALLTPGWTDYRRRLQYQTYDVAALLAAGDNDITAILADGWYAGMIGWNGTRNHYGGYPLGLLARLEIEYEDGKRDAVVTDARWQAASGPLTASDMLLGETYDARREPGPWQDVTVLPPPGRRLVAERGPRIEPTRTLNAVALREAKPGIWIFDFGQNIVGHVRLRVQAKRGTELHLRHAEVLEPDGTLYTANLRRAAATDRYICHGEGEEVWEPRFVYHGFRYVELTGLGRKPDKDMLQGVVTHSATPETGTFECSSELVTQLWHNIVWGQRGNFVSVPTDCPQRDERMGWMGDAQIFAPTACYNMDVAAFFTKWLADVRDAQNIDGGFPDVAPRVVTLTNGAPAWGDAGVLVPWTMWTHYADHRLLARHYPAMQRWVAYVLAANPDLIWKNRTGNNYGDWLSIKADTPKDLLATAYFARTTETLGRIADVLDRDADASYYKELNERIVRAFRKRFVRNDGRIEGGTQTAYVLGLAFGLVPKGLIERAATNLVEDIHAHGDHLSTGFLGVAELLPVLVRTGHADLALKLLQNESFPSWGYSIKNGATTIWERWDGWTKEKGFQNPGMNSFNHYALGSVGAFLYESVAGIAVDPKQPAFRHVVVAPRATGELRWAKAALQTHRGRVAVSWRRTGQRLELDVEIPVGSRATVRLPCSESADLRESGVALADAPEVRLVRREPDAAILELASGRYSLTSQ